MTSKTATALPNITQFPFIADALTAIARRVLKFPRALAHRDQLRRLAECEDRLLADIGVTREDIEAALSTPSWYDPSTELVRRTSSVARMSEARSGSHSSPQPSPHFAALHAGYK